MAASKRISGTNAVSDTGTVTEVGRVSLGGIPATVPIDDRPVGTTKRWRHRRTYQYHPDGRCHSGDGCRTAAREGSRFCVLHGDELARIREAFEAEEAGVFRV